MSYQPTIPQATDQLSQSQSDIQGNFEAIQAFVDVNHVDFSDATDMGKHNFVSLVQQASVPATSSTEIALYSQLISGVVTLFLRPANNGTPVAFPFGSTITSGTTGSVTTYTLTLQTGLIMKWGQTSTAILNNNAWNTIPFTPAFPTGILNLQVSPVSTVTSPTIPASLFITLASITRANFQVYLGSSAKSDISFFAIGN
jgi:hypothetical protein